jgi:hypothetical protein
MTASGLLYGLNSMPVGLFPTVLSGNTEKNKASHEVHIKFIFYLKILTTIFFK